MTFYESVHCGAWRVQLNEQYIWSWLRTTGKQAEDIYHGFDVSKLAYLVEDRLNIHPLTEILNINTIIQEELQKMITVNEKQT